MKKIKEFRPSFALLWLTVVISLALSFIGLAQLREAEDGTVYEDEFIVSELAPSNPKCGESVFESFYRIIVNEFGEIQSRDFLHDILVNEGFACEVIAEGGCNEENDTNADAGDTTSAGGSNSSSSGGTNNANCTTCSTGGNSGTTSVSQEIYGAGDSFDISEGSSPTNMSELNFLQGISLGTEQNGTDRIGHLVISPPLASNTPLTLADVGPHFRHLIGMTSVSSTLTQVNGHNTLTLQAPNTRVTVAEGNGGTLKVTATQSAGGSMVTELNYKRIFSDIGTGAPVQGIFVNGMKQGKPYAAFTYGETAINGAGSFVVTIENGIKTAVTDAFVADTSDVDGFLHLHTVSISKAEQIEDATVYVLIREKTQTYRTPTLGADLLVEESVRVGPGQALVTHYTYDELPFIGQERNRAYRELTAQTNPDGSWTRYEHDSNGMIWRTYHPWLDSPATPGLATTANCDVTEITYNPDFPGSEATHTQSILGIQMKEWRVINRRELTKETEYTRTTRQRLTAAGTTESYHTQSVRVFDRTLQGKRTLAMTRNEEGVVTLHRREVGDHVATASVFNPSETGADEASITISPITPAGNTIAHETTKRVTVTDQAGTRLADFTAIATTTGPADSATFVITDGHRYSYDAQLRPTTTLTLDGTIIASITYPNATTIQTIDAEGIQTIEYIDPSTGITLPIKNKSARSAQISGIAHSVPAVTTSSTMFNDGRVATTHYRMSGATSEVTTSLTDGIGRISQQSDAAGIITTYAYGDGGRMIGEVRPGQLTRVTHNYRDGRLHTIAGELQVAELHTFAINPDGTLAETTYLGPDGIDSPRWTRSVRDGNGTLLRQDQPNPAAPTQMVSTHYYHDDDGRIIRVASPARAPQLTQYTPHTSEIAARGLDLNNDGLLTQTSSDPLTETTTSYLQRDGAWFHRTTTTTYTSQAAGTHITSVTLRKLGTGPNTHIEQLAPDGSITIETTTVDRANAIRTVRRSTRRSPGSAPSEQHTRSYLNGLLVSETLPGIPSPIIHTYGDLERPTSTTDPRTGTQLWQYDFAGRVSSASNAGTITESFYYPADQPNAGRLALTYLSGTLDTNFEYDGQGHLIKKYGQATYPISYTFDAFGQMTSMVTKPNETADTTTWTYQPATGLLLAKTDASQKATTYTYTAAGQIATRTWARTAAGAPLTTTYTYNLAGKLTTIDYSDATPDVAYTLDRLGRPTSITDASGTRTTSFTGPAGAWSSLDYAAESLLPSITLTRTFNDQAQEATLTASGPGFSTATAYTYEPVANRLASITHGGQTATYDWSDTLAGLPIGITYSGAGLHGQRIADANHRLATIAYSMAQATNFSSHTYQHDARGLRTAATREDGGTWAYSYNSRGEVTASSRTDSAENSNISNSTEYVYDNIGNRITSSTNAHATSYTVNANNQYNYRQNPNPAHTLITGEAHPAADIQVAFSPSHNGSNPIQEADQIFTPVPISRTGATSKGFSAAITTSLIGGGPQYLKVKIEATRSAAGPAGQDLTAKREGGLYIPPGEEVMTYDDDGNLVSDARWNYTWDAENRLIAMQTQNVSPIGLSALAAGVPLRRLEFSYDSQSRRIRKVVKTSPTPLPDEVTGTFPPPTWNVASDTRFLYNDWNLVAEFTVNAQTLSNQPNTINLLRSYAWGLDLSGSAQGAGGVGGLVLTEAHPPSTLNVGQGITVTRRNTLAPAYDGNGNVMAYVNVFTGLVTHRFEYDAFGRELTQEIGNLTREANHSAPPFRFSTKYTDFETALVYYGFRYYSPEMGRWLSRDPIGELGGMNLYGMCQNDPVSNVDVDGRIVFVPILLLAMKTASYAGAAINACMAVYSCSKCQECWNRSVETTEWASEMLKNNEEAFVQVAKTSGWECSSLCKECVLSSFKTAIFFTVSKVITVGYRGADGSIGTAVAQRVTGW